MNRTALAGIVSGLLWLSASTLSAHDFWIEPSIYQPKMGSLVGLRLLVGQDLIGDPVPREPAAIKQFSILRGPDRKEVAGRDGEDPAGVVRVEAPGLMTIGYQSYPRAIELAPDKFEQYLGEEGLDEIASLRKAGARSARELFSRCAKALLLSGAPSDDDRDRALGLTFEIVAERNPYTTAVGSALPFSLTFDGKPQAGSLVVAMSRMDPSKKLTARSDRNGRVVFNLPVAGPWLVKAVHMIAAKPGTNADWESFWASSTFEVPGAVRR